MPWALGAFALLFFSRKALVGIWEVNDFEVFHNTAVKAWHRSEALYVRDSIEERPFIYPPPAAFLLMPLGWLPHRASGTVFTLLRYLAFFAMFFAAVQWLKSAKYLETLEELPWLVLATIVICWRFIDSESGNGQINTHIAALAIFGTWLAFKSESKTLPYLGGILVAFSVMIKCTTAIFIFPLMLHRRYRALAAFAMTAVVVYFATVGWFGQELFKFFWAEWRGYLQGMERVGLHKDYLASIPSFVVSLAGRFGHPCGIASVRLWWLLEFVAFGVFYLVWRRIVLRKTGSVPIVWDIAVFAVAAPLLSPLTRKAHLVILTFPVFVAIVLLHDHRKIGRRSFAWIGFLAVAFLLLCGLSVPVATWVPGYNSNPMLVFGMTLLVLVLGASRFPEKRSRES